MEQNIYEKIRHTDEGGNEYWLARELAIAVGYKDYRNFKSVIGKAQQLCRDNGANVEDHFVERTEMVEVGSGANRALPSYRLTRYACLLIAMCVNSKKPQALQALQYFSGKQEVTKDVDLYTHTDIVFFSDPEGNLRVQLFFDGETVWTTQKRIAEIFQVDVRTVSYHINEIFETGELNRYSVIRKNWITAADGKDYETMLYNLDAIIAVGYRVNSYKATQFRIWATGVLKEFIIKGFVLDDERLKQGKHFGQDYFDDLLERIREIRTSERRYYQKITDVYAECSADYDPKSETTKLFFKMVQNMMHWAVTHQTAAEIIYNRADAEMPHMGLTTWKNAPDGRVQRSDTIVAKNYLSDREMTQLNRISNAFLDLAENRADRHLITTMAEWKQQLERFMAMYDYEVLEGAGTVSAEEAKEKAYGEYDKFRLIQDREYLSDFDKEIRNWKELGLFDGDRTQ